ncbi:MAG: hypothetical protein ACRD2J_14335 [Thermoanaerobaculia bacterium]
MRSLIAATFAFVLVTGCAEEPETAVDTAPAATETAEPAAAPQPITGLQTPESVLYDAEQDVYFVSNINGTPLEADDNGFVSRVAAEGGNVQLKWIDGAAEACSSTRRRVWASSATNCGWRTSRACADSTAALGEPRGEIAIEGAGFLNDVAASGDAAWVSDSGLRAGAAGFEPSGTDAIYRVD